MKDITLLLVEELLSAINLATAEVDRDGHVSLLFDNELMVNVELKESELKIVFVSMVGLLDERHSDQQFRHMMALNLAMGRESNMSLGWERESNAVLLIHGVDIQHAGLSVLKDALSLVLYQTEMCKSMLKMAAE